MQGLTPPLHPAKAVAGPLPRGALPQLLENGKGFAGFSTSRTILHAARNGHISISRQRALACRQEGASLMSLLSLKSLNSLHPRSKSAGNKGSLRSHSWQCKHESASTGPQAIAPWCARAPRVVRGNTLAVLRRSRLSPVRASRTQPGVSVALPPVIKARVSVYRASSARPAMLCGSVCKAEFIIHNS